MKFFTKLWLVVPVIVVLGIVSCEKNLPDGQDPAENEDSQLSPEQAFWRVVGQLVDRSQRTDDYKNKTFAPTIGEPDNGDESVRIVAVNDLGAAVSRFNNLVGAGITEETSSYNYRNQDVGTLIWNKSTDNKSWATVDVSIQQVPSLQKIKYRGAEQGDVNGSVGDGGSAYYSPATPPSGCFSSVPLICSLTIRE